MGEGCNVSWQLERLELDSPSPQMYPVFTSFIILAKRLMCGSKKRRGFPREERKKESTAPCLPERKKGRKKEKSGFLPKSAVCPSHPTTVACIG